MKSKLSVSIGRKKLFFNINSSLKVRFLKTTFSNKKLESVQKKVKQLKQSKIHVMFHYIHPLHLKKQHIYLLQKV